jgi:DNA polymerase type B, organellar and viral
MIKGFSIEDVYSLFNLKGQKQTSVANFLGKKKNIQLADTMISVNDNKPKQFHKGKIGSNYCINKIKTNIKSTQKGKSYISNYKKLYDRIKVKIGDNINEFKDNVFINFTDENIIDDDEIMNKIYEYHKILILKWNEHTIQNNDKILLAKLILIFNYNDDQYFTMSIKLHNLTINKEQLELEFNKLSDKYGDDNEIGLNFLNSMELIIYYSNQNNILQAFGGKKKTKNSIFSPVLNMNICLCEVACFLMCDKMDIITSGDYRFKKFKEWSIINEYGFTERNKMFNDDMMKTFSTGDVREFICIWNIYYKKLKLVLYNTVTQQYTPYKPTIETEYVLWWYNNHVEVFLPNLLVEKPKTYIFKPPKLSLETIKINMQIETIICTLDIESFCIDDLGKQIPYLICIYSKEFKIHFNYVNDVNEVMIGLMNFFKILTNNKDKKYVFWAHNGLRYDYLLMLKELFKEFNPQTCGKLNELKSIEFNNIKMLDFYKFNAYSLNSLSKMCLNKEKLEFDFNRVKSYNDVEMNINDAIKYCEMDCELLYELVMLFENKCNKEYNISMCDCVSASQLSKTIYQNKYLNDKIKGSINEQYIIEKSSYRGGMCMNLVEGYINKQINVYDINSSYPYAMLQCMPCHFRCKKIYNGNKSIIDHFLYNIEFEFNDNNRIVNLGMKYDNNLLFLKKGNGWYWGVEIKLSIKLGAKIIYKEICKYTPKAIFKEFVLDIYQKRLDAKNEIDKQFCKMLLNSLYGKFGSKLHDKGSFEKFTNFLEKDLLINDIVKINDDVIYVTYEDSHNKYNTIGSLVRFSSYICALGRCRLLEPILELDHNNVLYMDTDSLFLTCELPPEYIDNKKLGMFKHEKQVQNGIFISAKCYMLYPITFKMKGVNIKNVSLKNYEDLLSNRKTFINTIISRKSFGNVSIFNKKKLVTAYNYKRFLIENQTYPHNDIISYEIYKNIQKKCVIQIKKEYNTVIHNTDNIDVKWGKNIIKQINNFEIVILPHNDKYNTSDINTYLTNRILGFNTAHAKYMHKNEKKLIYDKIYKRNDISMLQILKELYPTTDDWRIDRIGYLKQLYLNLKQNQNNI